jgi:pyruvate dehydrogenase E1 component
MDGALRREVLAGAYWLVPPEPGAELAVVFSGALAPEAIDAHAQLLEDVPGAGLLAVTSADRLHAGWLATPGAPGETTGAPSIAHIRHVLAPLASDAALVTVADAHPAALSWLGAVRGQRVYPLGVTHFGQSGDIPDLYREHEIDADAILAAAARACLDRARGPR